MNRTERAWALLDSVADPEVPALSVRELGIVRDVIAADSGSAVEVVLTPTYSGCPATELIARDVHDALSAAGYGPVTITQRRAPAWTSDWISASGRRKLLACGIAPPGAVASGAQPIFVQPRPVACPRCSSADTERLSAFGSTACKALYRCRACGEPYEHFKPT